MSALERAVRILHLSDLGLTRARWEDLRPAAERLCLAVARLTREGLAPDLVVVTGDLSANGAREELELAFEWLSTSLLPAAELGPERLFLVPGGRDVDRSRSYLWKVMHDELRRVAFGPQLEGLVADLWREPESREVMLDGLRTWRGLERAYGPRRMRGGLPWWRERIVIERRGHRLELDLVGLCSAWAATGSDQDDYGRLILGATQTTPLLDVPAPAPIVVGLMHHPPDWFTYRDERARADLAQLCPVLLQGRDERPGEHLELRPTGPHLRLSAGHVFHPDPDRRAAALVEVSASDVRVYRWRWKFEERGWVREGPFHPLERQQVLPEALAPRAPPPLGDPPSRPYPELGPITHPAALGGRRAEIQSLLEVIDESALVVGLHAASGAGKSSLLQAGLLPALRSRSVPVIYEARPAAIGLAGIILSGLLENRHEWMDEEPRRFAARLARLRDQVGVAPVIVLDQVEDLFAPSDDHPSALGRLGLLLSATEIAPGGRAARWVLAYRHELHASVESWMGDVLRESAGALEGLPRDLSRGAFRAAALDLLGHARGAADREKAVIKAFKEAILTPLGTRRSDGAPSQRYRMADADADRLARAFARQRLAHSADPLTPELQVVLARLVEEASPGDGDALWLHVPDGERELDERISQALGQHLRGRLWRVAGPGDERVRRRAATDALLLLSMLVGPDGRRRPARLDRLDVGPGTTRGALLRRLQGPEVWLVRQDEVLDEASGERHLWVTLPHDRLATEIRAILDDPTSRARFDLDEGVVELWGFVLQRAAAFRGGDQNAVDLRWGRYNELERRWSSLPRDPATDAWWRAAQAARERVTRSWLLGLAAVLVVVIGLAWRVGVDRERLALEGAVRGDPPASGEPLRALFKLKTEYGYDGARLAGVLGVTSEGGRELKTEARDEIFGVGPAGLTEAERLAEIQPLVEALAPHVQGATDDESFFGALLAAVEFVRSQDPAVAERSKQEVVSAMRAARGQPPAIVPTDDSWTIPIAGTFTVGCFREEKTKCLSDEPLHEVRLSRYRMRKFEETLGQYRHFDAGHLMHEGPKVPAFAELFLKIGGFDKIGYFDNWPAMEVNWYEASAYAAWFGAALATEAQWEVAARGGCDVTVPACRPDDYRTTSYYFGSNDKDISLVGFTSASQSEISRAYGLRPLSADEHLSGDLHPLGLTHIHGNVFEWTADWYAPYVGRAYDDPRGPADPPDPFAAKRVLRGGSWTALPSAARLANRSSGDPSARSNALGFRLALPDPPPPTPTSAP